MIQKLFYKVVQPKSSGRSGRIKLTSLNCLVTCREVTYKPQAWVSSDPKLVKEGYGLCCFTDLQDALDFCNYNLWQQVWSCHIRNSWKPKVSVLIQDDDDNFMKLDTSLNAWPTGTVMAKSVKLIQRVIIGNTPQCILRTKKN